MRVTVQNLDGSKIYPAYSPEHKESVMAFYANAVATKQIDGYVITFADRSVVAEGSVL